MESRGTGSNERTIQTETTMTSVPTPAIEATGLTRLFGDARAVDGLDLAVPVGLVYGLLGPNGAGKTTTIRMLTTLLRPDGGTARVFGKDVVREAGAVRRRLRSLEPTDAVTARSGALGGQRRRRPRTS
jgi:ABC-type multidrug transport system ATPase subunit